HQKVLRCGFVGLVESGSNFPIVVFCILLAFFVGAIPVSTKLVSELLRVDQIAVLGQVSRRIWENVVVADSAGDKDPIALRLKTTIETRSRHHSGTSRISCMREDNLRA